MLRNYDCRGATVAANFLACRMKKGMRVETRLQQGLQVWERSAVGSANDF